MKDFRKYFVPLHIKFRNLATFIMGLRKKNKQIRFKRCNNHVISRHFYDFPSHVKVGFCSKPLGCSPDLATISEFRYTAILYRARTGPEQGFPCEVFHTGNNLFSLQGTPVLIAGTPLFITGISLWENLTGKTLFSLQGLQCIDEFSNKTRNKSKCDICRIVIS